MRGSIKESPRIFKRTSRNRRIGLAEKYAVETIHGFYDSSATSGGILLHSFMVENNPTQWEEITGTTEADVYMKELEKNNERS